MESWSRLLKLAFKWGTLPVLLLVFFGGGWHALRMAWDYKETTGVVTQYRCAKSIVVDFAYTVDEVAHQGSSVSALSGLACDPYYKPGDAVRVFYSTPHPEIALMNATPRQALRHQFLVVLAVLLAFPFVTFMLALRESNA